MSDLVGNSEDRFSCVAAHIRVDKIHLVSMVAYWYSTGPRNKRSWVQYSPLPCSVLEQDILSSQSTGFNTH